MEISSAYPAGRCKAEEGCIALSADQESRVFVNRLNVNRLNVLHHEGDRFFL
jgi:hypothetical protein